VTHRRNFAKMFDTPKTRMIVLPCGEETMTICSARIPERDVETDRQTDKIAMNIAREHADAR